ncbi:MAG: carboxypeptidase regulatory-like domain-containing protein [Myxococcota bacterium]
MRGLLFFVLCFAATAVAQPIPASPTRLRLTGGVSARSHAQRFDTPAQISGLSPTVVHLSAAHFFHPNVGLHLEGRGELFFARTPALDRGLPQGSFDLSLGAAGRFQLAPAWWLEGQLGWAVAQRSLLDVPTLSASSGFVTGPTLGVAASWAPTRAFEAQAYVRALPVGVRFAAPPGFQLVGLAAGVQASVGALHFGTAQLGLAVSLEYNGTVGRVDAGSFAQHGARLGLGVSLSRWMEPAPPPKPAVPPLRGRVVAQNGDAVAGATVTLDDGPRQRSDGSGVFQFSSVPRGKHRLVAVKDGFAPAIAEVTAPTGLVELRLGAPQGPGRVTGVVRGPDGPLAGAEVRVLETQVTTKSGADGSYALEGVGPGPVTVQVKLEGFAGGDEVAQVPPGGVATVDLTLTPKSVAVRATLRGLIRSKSGEPVKATVRVVELKLRLQVKPDGRFSAEVPSGKYTLVIEARGFVSQTKSVEVSGGDQAIFHAELERIR